MCLFDEVIIHSDPHNKGKTITAAALATNVNVMKLGILGILHTNGENKHQSITKRYIFELAIFNGFFLIISLDLITLTLSVIK